MSLQHLKWFAALVSLLAASCARAPHHAEPPDIIRRSQPLLGTFVTITAHGTNRADVLSAVERAFDEVRRVDALMSVHRTDSELAQVNARAARQAVEISPELFFVLSKAQEISFATEGAFDATIAPVLQLWGFVWKQNYKVPNADELAVARSKVSFKYVHLDPTTRSVRLSRDGVSIDLGGIAKGYAVDLAVQSLMKEGVTAAMVKAGGDLRVFGTPPGQRSWTVQLEDPAKTGKRSVVHLRDAALSTSGNYENFFIHDGIRYSHILDPRIGWPVSGVAACTVVADTCLESDAWATAAFVLGPERARSARASLAFRMTLITESGLSEVTSPHFNDRVR